MVHVTTALLRLYNKENIINFLLNKESLSDAAQQSVKHITKLKVLICRIDASFFSMLIVLSINLDRTFESLS
jgi:hypothetical protein